MDVTQLVGREGNVAAIANDVNDESFGNGFLNAMEMKQMFGSGVGPSLDALLATHLGHDDAQEISAVSAFGQHLGSDFFFVQTRKRVETAVVPGFEQVAFVGDSRK